MRRQLVFALIFGALILIAGAGHATGAWDWLYGQAERIFTEPVEGVARPEGLSRSGKDGEDLWEWREEAVGETGYRLTVRRLGDLSVGPMPARVDVLVGGECIATATADGPEIAIECDIAAYLHGWGRKEFQFEVYNAAGERAFSAGVSYTRPLVEF